jgi:hypothetical protein
MFHFVLDERGIVHHYATRLTAQEIALASSQLDYRKELLDKAQLWCRRTGRKLSYLGREIMNDGAFFPRLAKKKSGGCRMETYFKIRDWFHKNMPEAKS